MGSENSQDFLSRWSRRKAEQKTVPADDAGEPVDAEVPEEQPASSVGAVDASAASDDAQTREQGLLGDDDMPPLDSLDQHSDISAFFNKGVSAALRKKALRAVFSLPQYNVRDGLNDYDGDYTVFEPLGNTVTADMKFHAARKEAERLRLAGEEADLEPDGSDDLDNVLADNNPELADEMVADASAEAPMAADETASSEQHTAEGTSNDASHASHDDTRSDQDTDNSKPA